MTALHRVEVNLLKQAETVEAHRQEMEVNLLKQPETVEAHRQEIAVSLLKQPETNKEETEDSLLKCHQVTEVRLLETVGQTRPVHFCHLIAEGTIDEAMYKSLQRKRDVIDAIKDGTFDYGFVK